MSESLSSLISAEAVEKMKKALDLLGGLQAIEIKTKAEYEAAAEIQKSVKKAMKDLDNDRTDIVKPFNDKVKAINEKFKDVTGRLENGAKKISLAMSVWYQAEERRIALEQQKREAEAAEARRKAEEAAAKELAKAEEYRAQGRDEMADKAEARAEIKAETAATIVAPEIEKTKTAGVSYRTDYEVTIIDREKAIKMLLSSPMTSDLVSIDEGGLKRMVKAMNGKFICDGINVVETKVQVIRT